MDGHYQGMDGPVIVIVAAHRRRQVDGRPTQWRRLSKYAQRRLGIMELFQYRLVGESRHLK